MKPVLAATQARSRERRRLILLAATEVFGEQGIARTRMAEIAKRAGVPLSSIYDYFGGKEHLLYEVPRANFEELYRETDARLAELRGARDRVIALYELTFGYIERHPAWGRVFFLEIWPSALVGESVVAEAIDDYALRFVRLFREGQRAGEFRADLDPYLLADIFLGSMCQIVATWLLYRRPRSLTDAVGPLVEHLLRAAPPPEEDETGAASGRG